jgi:hypothetical protein
MQQRRSEEPVPIVPLNRRFVEWNEKEPTDPEFRQAMGLGEGGVGWDELLEKRRVVILAEAGSGKSKEMAERARLTAAGGRFAFHATVAGGRPRRIGGRLEFRRSDGPRGMGGFGSGWLVLP